MATLQELRTQGNAQLGLGASPEIGAAPNANLDLINQTANNIMLLNNQFNEKIFQDKVNQRDDITKMIANDQVKTGNILPQYQPEFDKAKKESEDAFLNWGGNYNDTKGFLKYRQAINKLNDVATHAQANTLSISALQAAKAKETLPSKQKAIQDHIDAQLKQNFWNPITPYQQAFDVNFNDINKYYSTITGGEVISKDGLWINTGATKADWKTTLRKATDDYYTQADGAENQRQVLQNFQKLATPDLNKAIDAIDAQIDKYNTQLGLKQGNDGFVDHIKRSVLGDGTSAIQEAPNTFAAKYALANQNQFVTTGTTKFNTGYGTYKIGQEKNAIGWKNANTAAQKGKVYADYMQWKMSPTDEEEGGKQAVTLWKDLTGNIKFGSPIEDVTKVTKNGNVVSEKRTKKGEFDYIPATAIPESRKFIGGITYDQQSKKYVASNIEPTTFANGVKGYTVRYKIGGKVWDRNDAAADVTKNFKKAYASYKQSHPNDSEQDYIKRMVDDGTLEVEFEGKGGKIGTLKSAMESARAINNALYKKGQPDIINPNEGSSETDNGEE